MIVPGFIGPSYEAQSSQVSAQQCINFYPERYRLQGHSESALYPCPGFASFATGLNSSGGRGIFYEDGRLFAVFGDRLYEVTSAGVATEIGSILDDAKPAQFATNGDAGDELLVTSGGRAYVYGLVSGSFQQVDEGGVRFASIIDGYFLTLNTTTSTLNVSAFLDGTTWSGTQIIQRNSASDPWEAMIVVDQEAFLLGRKTGEVFYNAGASPVPFRQQSGGVFETGIVAVDSLARFGDTFAWLGGNERGEGRVYMMQGYQPVPISPAWLEDKIETFRREDGIEDAIGWSYQQSGHTFYVLSFPAADRCWVYDSNVGQWHERAKWDGATGRWKNYRAVHHAAGFSRNLVCDAAGGTIYDMQTRVYVDVDGDPLRRLRRSPHYTTENKRQFFTRFELEYEEGVGLQTGQGATPEIVLRYSNDGGRTWPYARQLSAGAVGEYENRLFANRLGSSRARVWEVYMSDPVPWRLTNAYYEGFLADH